MRRDQNRLGHGIAYSQMEEVDTAFCMQKISLSKVDAVLPTNIDPEKFTTLAWDNIDRLEQRGSGGGTPHRVNGIVVQAQSTVMILWRLSVCPSQTLTLTISQTLFTAGL